MLKLIYITKDLKDELKNKDIHLTHHSMYSNACNFSTIQEPFKLIGAVNHKEKMGPRTMVFFDESDRIKFFKDVENQKYKVLRYKDVEHVLEIDLKLDLEKIKENRLFSWEHIIESFLNFYSEDSDFYRTLLKDVEERDLIDRYKKNLIREYGNNVETNLLNSANIFGLGRGATPSSDDYFCGLYLSISLVNKPLSNMMRKHALLHIDKTTDISKEIIRHVLEDRYSLYVKDFINSVEKKSPSSELLIPFLRYGASSGKDFLLGVLDGIKLLKIFK